MVFLVVVKERGAVDNNDDCLERMRKGPRVVLVEEEEVIGRVWPWWWLRVDPKRGFNTTVCLGIAVVVGFVFLPAFVNMAGGRGREKEGGIEG